MPKPYSHLFSKHWPLVIMVAVWWIFSLVINDAILVPSPWDTVTTLITELQSAKFWRSVAGSFSVLVLSWSVGMIILLLASGLSSWNHRCMQFATQITVIFSPIPTFAFLPILLIIFGISFSTMILLLIYSMIWINLATMLQTVRQVDFRWRPQVDNIGLSGHQAFWSVYLPAMVPDLIQVSKNSWALVWRSLLAVEVMFGNLGSGTGIGVSMMEDRTMINTSEIWAALLFIAGIGITVSWLFDRIESKYSWMQHDGPLAS